MVEDVVRSVLQRKGKRATLICPVDDLSKNLANEACGAKMYFLKEYVTFL